MRKNIITTIEMSGNYIKVIRSNIVKGKRAIDLFEIREIGEVPDSSVIKIISEIISTNNIPQDSIIFVVPRKFSILKQLKLPSLNDSEIKKMVGLQLVSQLPYSLEDIIYDYQIIGKDDNGYSNTLVFILHKEVSQRYSQLLTKIGINSDNIIISSLGIWGWIKYQENNKILDMINPIAVIDMDLTNSEICFFYDKQLLFSRNLNSGIKDINNDKTQGLIEQISLSLRAYKTDKMGPELSKIIILSSLTEVLSLRSCLEQCLNIKVDFIDPLENIFCKKDVNLSNIKGVSGISLTVSLGLHMFKAKKKINLADKEILNTKSSKMIRYSLVRLLIMVFLTAFLVVSLFGINVFKKNLYLNKINKRLLNIKNKAKQAKEKINFVKTIKAEFDNRIFIPGVIRELIKLAPRGISFRAIYLDNNGILTIQGYAEEGSMVNTFQNNLVSSHEFKNVNLGFATKRRIYNMEITDFRISLEL